MTPFATSITTTSNTNTASTFTISNEAYSYKNGTYSTLSSGAFGGGYYSYYPFNNNTGNGDPSWSTSNDWSGGFNTNYSSSTNLGTITGSWLQILIPYTSILTSYSIRTRGASDTTSVPKVFYVAGSNNGTSWTIIDTRTNATQVSDTITYSGFTLPATAYSYYRLIINQNYGSSYTSIIRFDLNGYNPNAPPTADTTLLSTKSVSFTFPSGGSTIPGNYIACSSTGQYVSFCCDLKIYYSSDYGATFNVYTSANNMYAISMSSSGQYQLAVSTGIPACSIYVSNNYGVTWTIPLTISTNNYGRWIQSLCMNSTGQYMFCGGSGGSGTQNRISTNYGVSWTMSGGILGRNSCAIHNTTLAVYAGQMLNNPVALMYTSLTDATLTENTGPTITSPCRFIACGGNNWVYIDTTDYGYYSSTATPSWGSAIKMPVTFIALWYNSAGTRLWGATATSLYFSLNNGSVWNSLATSLTNMYAFTISPDSSKLFILTQTGSIYWVNISIY